VFAKFMTKLLNHPEVKPLLSDQHFSADGTLIEAWASHKSFRPKDGSGDEDDGTNFHGQQRKNDTHASTSDPDSRLYRKARWARGKALLHGPRHHGEPAWAGGGRHGHPRHRHCGAPRFGEVGEDKAYDTTDHMAKLRALNVTPHVTRTIASLQPTGVATAPSIDARRGTRAMACRNRAARWSNASSAGEQHGTMRKTKPRGIAAVTADSLLNLIAYDLIRISKLLAA
jgi:hypothetical protein